ncbi:MAG: phosphate acetyltransferase [Planctomycetota bacterium]
MPDVMQRIHERAQSTPRTICLPEAQDKRVLEAAVGCRDNNVADIVLVGEPGQVKADAEAAGLSLEGIRIIPTDDAELRPKLVETVVEKRKHKGMTAEEAGELLNNRVFFAVAMLAAGEVDGVVSGSVSATAEVIRPALQLVDKLDGVRTVSSCFLMVLPTDEFGADGAFIYADCGLVPDPGAEQLAQIAVSSAKSMTLLVGAEPKIGMLSFSTKGSAQHRSLTKVIEATGILKDKHPELDVDGELQLDAAVVPSVGKRKAPDSPVAGQCNVLIFPDLNAGNIGYKLTQRFAGATAIGPIVQGLKRPVNDLSRGCSSQDIVDLVAVTCVMVSE